VAPHRRAQVQAAASLVSTSFSTSSSWSASFFSGCGFALRDC
jgi:hypothetical protein